MRGRRKGVRSNNNNVTCISIPISFLQNVDGVKEEPSLANEHC